MSKRKKGIICLVVAFFMLFLAFKILLSFLVFKYPVYKITKNGEAVSDIETVEIDGVIYESMEDTKWSHHGFDELIGYAGGINWAIYQINDSDNDFIVLEFHTIMDMRPQPILFRKSTIEIDEPNLNNINDIKFSKKDKTIYYNKNEVREIGKALELIENGIDVKRYTLNNHRYIGNIILYNKKYSEFILQHSSLCLL